MEETTMQLDDLELDGIRALMANEINLDIEKKTLYMSKRLKPGFEDIYITSLRDASASGNTKSFAQCISDEACLKLMEPNPRSKTGKMKKTPWDAHITLAEGEFNRLYMRAVCLKAMEENYEVEVYRAKQVARPRSASKALIGTTVDSKRLLEDLRNNPGVDTALGIPAGPNSGLSVRIKK